ncbi:MAG: YolD-like family protein [Bacilli bacterium]|nr:YolD-like family protein [Bacilli bacterium]
MNEDRGMMKWAPYQSLVEQATSLALMRRKKQKVERPLVASDQAEEINEILVHYAKEEVAARYWEDGCLYDVSGIISKIDAVYHFLVLNGKKILFRDLIRLSRA